MHFLGEKMKTGRKSLTEWLFINRLKTYVLNKKGFSHETHLST